MQIRGRHALITGSSRGIGRGIALRLAQEGVKVAVHYYQNEKAAKATLADIKKKGSDGFTVQANVLEPNDIARLFDQVKAEFGGLDIFVSNARPEAPAFFEPPMTITLDQWDTAVNSQGKALLIGARTAAPMMSDQHRMRMPSTAAEKLSPTRNGTQGAIV
jgi:NAD(P)-dependent dehydrogenase (short-subunit alcohol dehydrogenase family)